MSGGVSLIFAALAVGVALTLDQSSGAPSAQDENGETSPAQAFDDKNRPKESKEKIVALENAGRLMSAKLDRLEQELATLLLKADEIESQRESSRERKSRHEVMRRRRDTSGKAAKLVENLVVTTAPAAVDEDDHAEEEALAVDGEGREHRLSHQTEEGALRKRLDALEAIVRRTTARSCEQLRKQGEKKSGHYFVDPDGVDVGDPPIRVYCIFDEVNGIAETHLSHDLTDKTVDVARCSSPGCSRHVVTYPAPQGQISALVEISTTCSQQITYDCYHAPLSPWAHLHLAWWVGRDRERKFYWSGPDTKGHVCACGASHNCTAEPYLPCNCDAGAPEWFQDDGILTDKDSLPVHALHFGGLRYPTQEARFALGPMKCSGINNAALTRLDSCLSLKMVGHRASGYYLLDSTSHDEEKDAAEIIPGNGGDERLEGAAAEGSSLRPAGIRVAKCSFDLEPRQPGFEETILRIPPRQVVFSAYRNTTAKSRQPGNACCELLNFDGIEVNIGGGLQGTSGLFLTPVSGIYFLSFMASRELGDSFSNGYFGARIYKGGSIVVAEARSQFYYSNSGYRADTTLTITTILRLKADDEITVRFEGSLGGGAGRSVQFNGFLLANDE